MVSCDTARIPEVAETIADLSAVSEVYSTTGAIDLIAIVRVREFDEVAEAYAAGRRRPHHHLVAVLQEGVRLAPQVERLGAVPGQLEQAAALLLLRAGDGAGAEQVAGPQRGAVHGQVGEHLSRRVVHRRVRAGGDGVPVD